MVVLDIKRNREGDKRGCSTCQRDYGRATVKLSIAVIEQLC